MATKVIKLPDGSLTESHDFLQLIDVTQCRMLIQACVANLEREHTALEQARLNPQPLDEQTRIMFGLGKNHSFTTVDLAKSRIAYYERAQDRLWAWYKRLTGGEAK